MLIPDSACTYSSTVLFFFVVSAIDTLIVVACHVLFVTTVWISENELRESINIIMMMLISAHVRNSLRSNKFHQFIIALLQVIRDIRMYIPPHSSHGGVPFPWVRTGTAAAVYSYIRTAV